MLVSSSELSFLRRIQNSSPGENIQAHSCAPHPSVCARCWFLARFFLEELQRPYLALNRICTCISLGFNYLLQALALWGITASRNLNPYLSFLQGAFVRVAPVKGGVTRPMCQDDSPTPGGLDSYVWEGHPKKNPARLSPCLTQPQLHTPHQPPETIQIKTHQLAVVKPWVNHAWTMRSERCCLSKPTWCR